MAHKQLFIFLVLIGTGCLFSFSHTLHPEISPRTTDGQQPIIARWTTPGTSPLGEARVDQHSATAIHSRDDSQKMQCRKLPLNRNVTTDPKNAHRSVEEVELCYSDKQCTGTVSIRFQAAPELGGASRRKLSHNITYETWIRTHVGPNEFRLRLNGPEVHLLRGVFYLTGRHEALSKVVFNVPMLGRRGRYNVELEWLYDHYNALDEVRSQWPPLIKQSLLPILPNFTTNYHLQQCTWPSTVDLVCVGATSQQAPKEEGRFCSGFEQDTSGHWVLHPDDDASRPIYTRVRVRKIQKNPIRFQWALQPDRFYVWVPHQCKLKVIPGNRMLEKLHEKRLVVGGDSQLRALYYGIVNTLKGNGEACVRNISRLEAEPSQCVENVKGSQRRKLATTQVDFVDDLFLDRFSGSGSSRYEGYDIIIVGFGQHPASKEHWTVDRYRRALVKRMSRVRSLVAKGKKVIWYGAPQYPHSPSGYPVTVKDWRTDKRLEVFNAMAKGEALKAKAQFVDAQAITGPMAHTSPDQAHFTNFVSSELVNTLFNMLMTEPK